MSRNAPNKSELHKLHAENTLGARAESTLSVAGSVNPVVADQFADPAGGRDPLSLICVQQQATHFLTQGGGFTRGEVGRDILQEPQETAKRGRTA